MISESLHSTSRSNFCVGVSNLETPQPRNQTAKFAFFKFACGIRQHRSAIADQKIRRNMSSKAMTPFSEADPAWTRKHIPPIRKHRQSYSQSQRRYMLQPGPQRAGHFSLTGPVDKRERNFHDDRRSLRKLNSYHHQLDGKHLNLDREDGRLSAHLGEKTSRGQNDGIHSLLKWILTHRAQFDCMRQNNDVHIVGRRALFRRIGVMRSVSYEQKNEFGWLIAACRFQGVIYMSTFTTDEKLEEAKKRVAGHDSQTWRAKQKGMAKMFKHVMRTPYSNVSSSINVNEKFYVTMLLPLTTAAGSKLGFLYDAQVDGYDEQLGNASAVPTNCYDCRQVRGPSHQGQVKSIMQRKYPDWWTRCYATGERGVIVGFRNQEEEVGMCQAIEARELTKPNTFEPADIIGCFRDVLQEIRERVVQADYDNTVYLLRWDPAYGREIRVAELDAAESEYKILPPWYVDEMTKKPPLAESASTKAERNAQLPTEAQNETRTSKPSVVKGKQFDIPADIQVDVERVSNTEDSADNSKFISKLRNLAKVHSTITTAEKGGDDKLSDTQNLGEKKGLAALQKHLVKSQQSTNPSAETAMESKTV